MSSHIPLNEFNPDNLFNNAEKNVFSHQFTVTNIAASSTVDGAALESIIVQAGHVLVPVGLGILTNDPVTAGTATAKVIDDGTEVTNGPEAVLDTTNDTSNTGQVSVPGEVQIAEGSVVNVSVTGDAGLLPTGTADVAITLYYYLEPVA
jgi:hypothetical protein